MPDLHDLQGMFAPYARAALALVLAWILGRWVKKAVLRVAPTRLDPTLRDLLATLALPTTLLLALPVMFDALGWSVTSLVAVLSTAGLAIAVALKDSLSNVASGALLLTTRPFQDDDTVTVAGVTGKVTRLRLFTTEVATPDGRLVNITNDKVLAVPIERHAHQGRLRLEIVVKVPRVALDAQLVEALEAAAGTVPGATGAAVLPAEFEDTHARLLVHAWVDRTHAVEARKQLFLALNAVLPAPLPTAPSQG